MAEPQGVHPVQIAPPGEARGPLQAQGVNCWLEPNARTPGHYLAGGSLLCALGWRACCFCGQVRAQLAPKAGAMRIKVLGGGGVGEATLLQKGPSPTKSFPNQRL